MFFVYHRSDGFIPYGDTKECCCIHLLVHFHDMINIKFEIEKYSVCTRVLSTESCQSFKTVIYALVVKELLSNLFGSWVGNSTLFYYGLYVQKVFLEVLFVPINLFDTCYNYFILYVYSSYGNSFFFFFFFFLVLDFFLYIKAQSYISKFFSFLFDFVSLFYSLLKSFIARRIDGIDHLVFCSFYKGGFTLYNVRVIILNKIIKTCAGNPVYKPVYTFCKKYTYNFFIFILILFYILVALKSYCITAFNEDVSSLSHSLSEISKNLGFLLSEKKSLDEAKDISHSPFSGITLFLLVLTLIYLEAKYNKYIGNFIFRGRGPDDDPEDDEEDDNIPEDDRDLIGPQFLLGRRSRGLATSMFWPYERDGPHGYLFWSDLIDSVSDGDLKKFNFFQFFLVLFSFRSLLPLFELLEGVEGGRSNNTVSMFFSGIKSIIEGSPSDYHPRCSYRLDTYIHEVYKQALKLVDSVYRCVSWDVNPSPISDLIDRISLLQERIEFLNCQVLPNMSYTAELAQDIHLQKILFSELLLNLKLFILNISETERFVTEVSLNP